MLRNDTSFSVKLTSKLKQLYTTYENDSNWNNLLKYYQYIIKNIILNPDYEIKDSRGLLLYFTMGMGKTRTAISVILSTIDKNIIIILPKSLQKNMEETYDFIKKEVHIDMKQKLNFVSLDAYNSSHQLKEIESGIDNSVIIIDEAHNFFRAIINGTEKSNAHKMYNQIMYAKNIKLLFLTGTPISKNPFEIVPCINMLAGKDILPINYDNFFNLYVDMVNKEILNRSYLANRLMGMVSYMSVSELSKDMFPIELPTIISKVEMSKYQYQKYLIAREKEELDKKTNVFSKSKIVNLSIPKQGNSSSYYVRSRTVSNYIEIDNNEVFDVSDVTVDNSPKMDLITKRLLNLNGLALVYSQFVNTNGLKQLALFLNKAGFSEYDKRDKNDNPKYIFYTGDTPLKTRNKIISVFNSDKNKYGDIIKVILISKTGAEGLDLKNVRETHQIEPYWNLSRNNQIKSRAIRYGSHLALPENDRTVQPYVYISIANKYIWNKLTERESKTIDEVFYDNSIETDRITGKFNKLLQDVSIECSYFNLSDSCYICEPTNEKLFSHNPFTDTKIRNPCITYKENYVNAKKITIDNIDYYYTEKPFTLYKFDFMLDAYINENNIEIKNKGKELLKITNE